MPAGVTRSSDGPSIRASMIVRGASFAGGSAWAPVPAKSRAARNPAADRRVVTTRPGVDESMGNGGDRGRDYDSLRGGRAIWNLGCSGSVRNISPRRHVSLRQRENGRKEAQKAQKGFGLRRHALASR